MKTIKKVLLPNFLMIVLVMLFFCNCSVHYLMTGSMEPGYPTGSLVLVSKLAAPEEGSVYAYRHNGKTVVHRIIEQNEQGYIFKGDANNIADPYIISGKDIEGKVIFTFPSVLSHEGENE